MDDLVGHAVRGLELTHPVGVAVAHPLAQLERRRPGGGDLDQEHARERRLRGEPAQVRVDPGAGARKPVGVCGVLRRPHVLQQLVAGRLVRGQEAVELVAEVLVEGLLRDAGVADDVVDGGGGVALLGDRPPDRLQEARPLRGGHQRAVEPVGASWQAAGDVGSGVHVVYSLVHYPAMDLTLSPSEQTFRDELRAWLADNHPGEDPPGEDAAFDHRRAWQRQLYDAGYAGFSWPKEYGGRGATLVEQALFGEEMARARAPQPANVLGLVMGGPVVIHHGTDEQKERWLNPILTGDEIWCQGFSEPDSGSDLASLKTKAVKSNGEWVVTGQKVWTTFAHKSKWCMLVARTDQDAPKHQGLTYFIMDMEQDEVQVRPLHQITNEPEFNELFIEEARIPDENVVGGVGNGWGVAITTLMNERAGLGAAAAAGVRMSLEDLKELARERGVVDDPVIRQRLAQITIEVELLRLNSWRGLTAIMKRGVPGPQGSLPKWQWSDMNQALTELAVDILGEDGAAWDSPWTYRLLRSRANSIEGGTTEILKNIIAERVLGLPKLR